jgi:hypothetical protein
MTASTVRTRGAFTDDSLAVFGNGAGSVVVVVVGEGAVMVVVGRGWRRDRRALDVGEDVEGGDRVVLVVVGVPETATDRAREADRGPGAAQAAVAEPMTPAPIATRAVVTKQRRRQARGVFW